MYGMRDDSSRRESMLSKQGGLLNVVMLIGWGALLTWLSLISSPPQVAGPFGWDKLQHAVAYGLLAWLVARVVVRWRILRSTHAWWVAWLATICFGVAIELLQWAMHRGRAGEWQDLVADALGALVVCVIFRHTCDRKYA